MPSDGYARPDLLAETEWLAANLAAPKVRVVDCDVQDAYRRAHIEGAVGFRVHHYVKHPDYEKDPRAHPLIMPPEAFAELMGGMGIGDDTLVVAYDGSGGVYAARLWWALSHYGHTNVKVLNGGWQKWLAEGRPISDDVVRPTRTAFTPRARADVLCTIEHGLSHVGDPGTVFLDVRSDGEWDGTNNRGNRRGGHVPGAVHLEWLNFVTSGKVRTFKPARDLRAMLEEAGVTRDKQVVPY